MEDKESNNYENIEEVKDKENNVYISLNPEESEPVIFEEETDKKDYNQLKKELDELNDKYLRLHADFDNYRKRMIKEKEDLHKYGSETIVSELLPVIDNLELALSHVNNDTDDSLVQGVEMTLKEIKKALGKFGLSEIESQYKPFDPKYHHAMSQEERDDIDENTVVNELRKGYMFKDRVLRPALVSVSRKPEVNIEKQNKNIEIKEEEENG